MKAVVIEQPNKVSVEKIEDPTPAAGQVVLKVEACGICGTDIHVIRGEFAPTRYPIVPGHEFCGEVVAVGRDVPNLRVGDFVAVDPSLVDGPSRPQGWDVVIDATGVIPAIEDGLTRVARGGTFLVFGVANADAKATFSPFRVYNDEITIIGSMAVLHSFERALALFGRGVIDS